jgi:RNA polymerase sigma-70 factor (ECF subfamily)
VTATPEIEALIRRVAGHDRGAFSTLYSAVAGKLFGVALRILQDRTEAEEVVQEAFVRIWLNADHYAASGLRPMTWLIVVTRNRALGRVRCRAPAGGENAGDPGPEAAPIGPCLDRLDAARAAAVRGAYLDGAGYGYLAARHDLAPQAVRPWLRRGLLILKECLSR